MEILTEPKNALVKQYQRMFELDGVAPTGVRARGAPGAISDLAVERKGGRPRPAGHPRGRARPHHVRDPSTDDVEEGHR